MLQSPCGVSTRSQVTAAWASNRYAAWVSTQPSWAPGMLVSGCAPNRSATRTRRRFNRASPPLRPIPPLPNSPSPSFHPPHVHRPIPSDGDSYTRDQDVWNRQRSKPILERQSLAQSTANVVVYDTLKPGCFGPPVKSALSSSSRLFVPSFS